MTEVQNSAPSTSENARPSTLLRWLVGIGFCVPLALIVLAASPLGTNFVYVVVGIPALLFVWAIAGLGAAIVSIRSAIRRQWRQCIVASTLPIVLLGVAFNPTGFVRFCNYLGDVSHFIIMKPRYDKAIAALPPDQRPRVVVFNWGGMVWASSGLVYDETDEVALAPGRQSAAWLAQASHSELGCGGYGIQSLWDHYYLASFPC
jgi:hypothetical protein